VALGAIDRRAFGNEGEDASARFLEANGYVVLARNFRCRYGELDLIAEKNGTICFVEVRMRSTSIWGDPSQTVQGAKQRRVVRTALHYLQAHAVRNRMIRFDVVSVLGRGKDAVVEHLPNAFDAGM
jgi:putative endonuclease